MPEYQWALGTGEIVYADYNKQTDLVKGEDLRQEILAAFEQFGRNIGYTSVDAQLSEVYTVTLSDTAETFTVCAKGTTPGGRSNLNDEQRVQQKSKYINYAYKQKEAGVCAVHLGIYKRDGQTIFCAWKLKPSSADPDTTISKQIKITTIAQAMKEGFAQQGNAAGEFVCAFRKEFMFFYIRNADWLHGTLVSAQTAASMEADEEPAEAMDLNDLLQLENRAFIFGCLAYMDDHGLLTRAVIDTLCDKGKCTELFHHNSLKGILCRADPAAQADEQRYSASGRARYYADVYRINGEDYYVSSEWYDKERQPFVSWIHGLGTSVRFKTGYTCAFDQNRIFFGAPGTGKSHMLNCEKDILLAQGGEYERVTFHPDYSYANFVGAYKPVPYTDNMGREGITYRYVPGPFMRMYVKALRNGKTDSVKPYLLIVEEINRANVAAVFGDIFQLLDRLEGISEYPIQASEDIKKYLVDELGGSKEDYAEIMIPDNLFIWTTMNSADQGVSPLDTAFKRRWEYTYLGIDDNEAGILGKKVILGQGTYRRVVEWNDLRKAINEELLTYRVNEDKLIGPYFMSLKNMILDDKLDPAVFARVFKSKVLMYLFDDAAKQKRPTLFAGCGEKARNQYSKICKEFDNKGVFIFCEEISMQFIDIPEDDEQ